MKTLALKIVILVSSMIALTSCIVPQTFFINGSSAYEGDVCKISRNASTFDGTKSTVLSPCFVFKPGETKSGQMLVGAAHSDGASELWALVASFNSDVYSGGYVSIETFELKLQGATTELQPLAKTVFSSPSCGGSGCKNRSDRLFKIASSDVAIIQSATTIPARICTSKGCVETDLKGQSLAGFSDLSFAAGFPKILSEVGK